MISEDAGGGWRPDEPRGGQTGGHPPTRSAHAEISHTRQVRTSARHTKSPTQTPIASLTPPRFASRVARTSVVPASQSAGSSRLHSGSYRLSPAASPPEPCTLHPPRARRVLGNMALLPPPVQRAAARVMRRTRHHNGGVVNICMSYTGREDMLQAALACRRGGATACAGVLACAPLRRSGGAAPVDPGAGTYRPVCALARPAAHPTSASRLA